MNQMTNHDDLNINITDIKRELTNPIDVIEFFEDPNNSYQEIHLDQLSNLASIIQSKTNIENALDPNARCLYYTQLYDLDKLSHNNVVYIVREMLIAQAINNLRRFLKANDLLIAIGVNINPDWVYYSKSNDQCYDDIVRTIDNFLHTMLRDRPHSIFKDDQEAIHNTVCYVDNIADQIYIYMSSTISFWLNSYIDNIYKVTIEKATDFLMNQYKDYIDSMSSLYAALDKKDATLLFVKQKIALDLYGWFENVLRPIVHNTLSTMFKTNYSVYNDLQIDISRNRIANDKK